MSCVIKGAVIFTSYDMYVIRQMSSAQHAVRYMNGTQ